MPNNPLPTPTPPNSPKNSAPVTGSVPQGVVPKVATNSSQGQPISGQNQPKPVPVQPVGGKPADNKPAAPAAVVTPGQIKPPVAQPKPGQPTNQPPSQSGGQPKPVAPLSNQATSQASGQPKSPSQPAQQTVAQPSKSTSQPVQPATQSPTAKSGVAQPVSAQPGATQPKAVQPEESKPLTAQPAPVQQPPARPNTANPPTVTPPAAGLPKPGQPAAKQVAPAPLTPPTGGVTPAASVTPATPTSGPTAGNPPAASVKKPPIALFAVIGVLVLGVVGFLLYSMFGAQPTRQSAGTAQPTNNQAQTGTSTGETKAPSKPTTDKQTTITYWGLWEPTEVLSQVISDFEKSNPQYKIDYRKQSHRDYRERLQTAIASGNGPDIFRFHASWTPMLQGELSPMPSSVMSDAEYKKVFYPIAAQQLAVKGRIVGIPLMYDGLALFYNVDILKTANAEPPQNWAELRSLADALTSPSEKSARGSAPLQRSGLAIGNAENVEHFSDILGLLILQNGGDLANPNSPEVRDALLFYTNFIKEDMVWSDALPSSTVAFARGDTAMMLAPSWRAHDVKNLNPNLEFGIAPAPKLADIRLGWATYWAEGVNVKSKNQDGAWAFLKYLSTADVLKKMYADAAQVRSFGEIYPRQDMAAELNDDPIVSQFLVDAPTADAWYLSSYTHDNGINDQLIKYYKDAVNGILAGQTVDDVIEALEAGTTQVLRQYNATE